jgi:hypothetical protein
MRLHIVCRGAGRALLRPRVFHAVLAWMSSMTSTLVSSAMRASQALRDSETSVVRQKIDDE